MMRTVSISGFGGGYEEMCQRMLARGVAYLGEIQQPVEMWEQATEYKNIYGVMVVAGPDLTALERCIIRPSEDCTGAMHQAVMGHLRFIHKNGREGWLEELAKHRPPEDFFDYSWDGQ